MDYREMIESLGCYKNEACERVGNRCDRCEAGQEYKGNPTCSFDTVSRFIEWKSIYNKKIININKLNNIRNNNYHKCIEEDWRNIYGERI